MRFLTHRTLASVLSISLLGTTMAQEVYKPVIRDSATHEQLSQTLRMAQQKDPIRNLGPAIGKTEEDPAKALAGRDLIKDSTILCYRGFLTLVPKRAVLHLPDHLKDRFEEKNKVKVVSWQEFYQGNRGWIRTVEVTREQAMGQSPMSEEVVETFKTSKSAIIATFKGGPISVLPYVAPEPEQPAGTETTAKPGESPLASTDEGN